jgi:hypothetical protein
VHGYSHSAILRKINEFIISMILFGHFLVLDIIAIDSTAFCKENLTIIRRNCQEIGLIGIRNIPFELKVDQIIKCKRRIITKRNSNALRASPKANLSYPPSHFRHVLKSRVRYVSIPHSDLQVTSSCDDVPTIWRIAH